MGDRTLQMRRFQAQDASVLIYRRRCWDSTRVSFYRHNMSLSCLHFEALIKDRILIASLYVNKMAFLERGCGEPRSRRLVIIHSKHGQGMQWRANPPESNLQTFLSEDQGSTVIFRPA